MYNLSRFCFFYYFEIFDVFCRCVSESLKIRKFLYVSDIWMFVVILWEMFIYVVELWMGFNGF